MKVLSKEVLIGRETLLVKFIFSYNKQCSQAPLANHFPFQFQIDTIIQNNRHEN